MKAFLFFALSVTLIISFCKSENGEQRIQTQLESSPELDYHDDTDIIEKAIETIEYTAQAAKKLSTDVISPSEEIVLLYDEITDTFEDLTEVLKEPDHAKKFVKAKGISRVIMPYMDVDNSKLRGFVLEILKSLFYALPDTTEVIPITVIDKLLDIFETDNNLAMKAHVLDILYKWLPENPKVQVRVMKLKGLEPFYEQVTKLDTSVISTLLDLFNIILNEHIKVHSERKQGKIDPDKLMLYQRIGLIERMSTPSVCNGLLNIFETTWSYSNNENNIIAPVFELIKHMKPYCVKVLKGKNKAVTLFETLLKYIEDDSKKEYFESLQLNITDIKSLLEDFLTDLKKPLIKDEF